MDWITDDIAIGNYLEAVDVKVLRQFRSVLSLIPILSDLRQSKKSTLVELREMHEDLEETAYCRLIQEVRAELESKRFEVVELIDGPGNDRRVFQRAIETLTELIKEAPPVLVHCQAGRSRSPAVVAGHLMKSLRLSASEALDRVASRRETYVDEALVFLLENIEAP